MSVCVQGNSNQKSQEIDVDDSADEIEDHHMQYVSLETLGDLWPEFTDTRKATMFKILKLFKLSKVIGILNILKILMAVYQVLY
jgi:hypothetical protein